MVCCRPLMTGKIDQDERYRCPQMLTMAKQARRPSEVRHMRSAPALEQNRGQPVAVAALFALGLCALLWPVISNPVPPLLDYGGHLSRVYVLYNLIHGAGFADMYRLHLAVIPDLAID